MAKEFIVYSATRASFEALVASGEVDNTQIGIIAESGEFWENGNYHPLVMLSDYLKKTDAVALAKDLTGSIEATPEEFTFRTSAGTKSIRDESAVIRRIKGNTSVWGQLLRNPNFVEGITYWGKNNGTLSIDNGSAKFTHTAASSQSIYQTLQHEIPKGHKVLCFIDYQRSSAVNKPLSFYLSKKNGGNDYYRIANIASDVRRVDYGIITTTDTISGDLLVYPFSGADIGEYVTIYAICLFDLTAIYGAGNEPTTLDGFKKTYPESYYPYCAPEVRSMRATGIETIGANAFNKDSVVGGLIKADGTVTSNDIYSVAKIEVVPNEVYTLTNVANAANIPYTYALYDSDDRFISVGEIKNSVTKPISVSGDVTIPMNARYIRVVVHNDYLDSCCVNLKHSGTLTAEEATYFKEVRMLPDIAKYFPDGMHSIGGVFDEINEESAVKRFGVVDLGTLTWFETSTKTGARRFGSEGIKGVAKYPSANNIKANIVCDRYDRGTADDTYLDIHCISIGRTGSIFVYDPNYNTTGSLTNFVASLQGVLLYYELAEPIVTPITEPLQLDYKVADFGTEKILNDLPSSPFRADIVYQFNAEGRIRDNARNIERLEEYTKNMATMEDVINAIPTEVATATQRRIKSVNDALLLLLPNILYDYSLRSIEGLEVPPLADGDIDYDNVWMVRCALLSSNNLSIPYGVMWKDGVAPSFSSWSVLDLTFRKTPNDTIIGEWKIYR